MRKNPKRRTKNKLGINTKEKRVDVSTLFFVGLPGLEPGKAGPESAVLPLHHSPNNILLFSIASAKVRQKIKSEKLKVKNFI